MNSLTEQILLAVEIVADEKISKLEYDKTIRAIVFSIVNLDTGEYKVRYNGNIFSAFSTDLKVTYKIDDAVYVIVPEGKFSNKKMITGLVTNQSLDSSLLTLLLNSIFEKSPDFNLLYGGLYDSSKSYGVIGGTPNGQPNSYNIIYDGPSDFLANGFHGLFLQYSSNYELIRIKASFLTQFHSVHNKGNYGIEVLFYAKGKDNSIDIVSYKLDLNSFNGDPYHLSVYSPQWSIIKVQKNYLLGFKGVKLFEEDFEYDKIVENGQITDKQNTTNPNIFVKDISILYVEQIDLSDTKYHLIISAPKGIAITDNISTLDLKGRLIHQGKDIMDENCKAKWFVRDLTIMIGSEEYDKKAGFGWRPLKKTDFLLTLDEADVKHEQRYKLLVDYNNVVLSAETEVFNHKSGYNYSIDLHTNGDDISLELINNINDNVIVGDWFLSYPDGSYNAVVDSQKKSRISVSSYLKYSTVIFYCLVYDYDKQYIVGTIEHTIVSSESEEDVTISYIGEDTFRYDANGDIAIEDSEKERTLLVNLAWKEGYGTAYTVQWLMRGEDGKDVLLTNSEYRPSKSMIDKLWIDNSNILHYNILLKYKVNFLNNTLIVKIKTITELEYLFDKEILFLKDGDLGTNGTTFVIAVRPYDKTTDRKLSGFLPLVYNNGWKSTLPLRCYVYKDGELINNNSNFSIRYRWTGVNISLNPHDSGNNYLYIGTNDRITVSGTTSISSSSNSALLLFYVKVLVTIDDKMNDRLTDVYASYPIDIAVGGISINLVNIDTIPSYIKYTSSGITPLFYNNDIKFVYNNINKTDKNSIKSLNTDILDIDGPKDGLYYLLPASSFIFENVKENTESNIGVLKCILNTSLYIIHPIIMYLDNYGNEAINGWDGTALDTGNGEYVFAPQVGAGIKDSYNRFTGVVMGADSSLKVNGKYLIGLYGYLAGTCTFGLKQDGKAFFGSKSGGCQINIDGTSGSIYGGNGGNSSNGMTINLVRTAASSDAIKVANGKFNVTYGGKMTATEADILGNIYAYGGRIGCDASKNGGWLITSNLLSSGSGITTVALNSNSSTELAIWAGAGNAASAPFRVTRKGFVYANNVNIKGTIEADKLTAKKEGNVAGWTITSTKLYNNSVGMASSGNAAFWAGAGLSDNSGSISPTDSSAKFLVTRNGKLYCSDAVVKGAITADSGVIAGWKIKPNGFYKDTSNIDEEQTYYLSATQGIKWGNDFEAKSSGVTVKGKITATSGKIGGWTIDENKIRARFDYNDTDGSIEIDKDKNVSNSFYLDAGSNTNGYFIYASSRLSGGGTFYVKRDGSIKANNANIDGTLRAKELYLGGSNINSLIGDKFDGGHLSNGSVGTNLIAASAITANLIAANAITASHILADAISTDMILVGVFNEIDKMITDKGYLSEYDVTTIIGNTITTGYIDSLGITARYVQAGALNGTTIEAELDISTRDGRISIGNAGGGIYANGNSLIISAYNIELGDGGTVNLPDGSFVKIGRLTLDDYIQSFIS